MKDLTACAECQAWVDSRKDFNATIKVSMAARKHRSSVRGLLEGLTIIEKYTEHAQQYGDEFHAEHDQIWVGNYEETFSQMTDEEKARMDELSWFEDEEGWATFC